MNTTDKKTEHEQNNQNDKSQKIIRPPLPEPNLFNDGVGMYDFHGDKDEKSRE